MRRSVWAASLLGLACAAANAGEILYSFNGGPVQSVIASGTFNTAGNTNCGVNADCNETSTFNVVATPGITFAGTVTLTSHDPATGNTTVAQEQITMVVDNAIAGIGPQNLVVAFVGDEMSPFNAPFVAGVGISGQFLSDNGDPTETAFAQGALDALSGPWNGAPSLFPPYTVATPPTGGINIPSPTPYWAANTIPVSTGISELVTFLNVSVGSHSLVTLPLDGEENDPAALIEDVPETGTFVLIGFGLAALGVIGRRASR